MAICGQLVYPMLAIHEEMDRSLRIKLKKKFATNLRKHTPVPLPEMEPKLRLMVTNPKVSDLESLQLIEIGDIYGSLYLNSRKIFEKIWSEFEFSANVGPKIRS
jgi:hypothetical protein